MAVVAGCQEVQGACLEGWMLGKACGGFGAFWGFEGFESGQTAQPWMPLKTDGRGGWLPRGARCLEGCLGKACGGFGAFWGFWGFEGFEGFEGGQTAALNALKNRWPWWLAAKRCKGPAWRVALERLAEGLEHFEGLKGFLEVWGRADGSLECP